MAATGKHKILTLDDRVDILKRIDNGQSCRSIGGFTVTSYAVSRGHPAPLVGKRLLADGLHVYFGLDSYLV